MILGGFVRAQAQAGTGAGRPVSAGSGKTSPRGAGQEERGPRSQVSLPGRSAGTTSPLWRLQVSADALRGDPHVCKMHSFPRSYCGPRLLCQTS